MHDFRPKRPKTTICFCPELFSKVCHKKYLSVYQIDLQEFSIGMKTILRPIKKQAQLLKFEEEQILIAKGGLMKSQKN